MRKIAEFNIINKEKVQIKTIASGAVTEVSIDLLCRIWEFKIQLTKKVQFDVDWGKMLIKGKSSVFGTKKPEIADNKAAGVMLEERSAYDICERPKALTVGEKVDLLREKHAGGRGGTTWADATINKTRKLAIIDYSDHDIDHFGEMVRSTWWLYDLRTMQEIELRPGGLHYRYSSHSGGITDKGVNQVLFDPKDPNKVVVTFMEGTPEEGFVWEFGK